MAPILDDSRTAISTRALITSAGCIQPTSPAAQTDDRSAFFAGADERRGVSVGVERSGLLAMNAIRAEAQTVVLQAACLDSPDVLSYSQLIIRCVHFL